MDVFYFKEKGMSTQPLPFYNSFAKFYIQYKIISYKYSDFIKRQEFIMKDIGLFHMMGIFWTLAAGFLLHFTYEWFDRKKAVGWFSAVNESIWEQTKLFFFPALFWIGIEFFTYGLDTPGFWTAKVLSLIAGCVLLPLFYFGYTGFSGSRFLWADAGSFVASVLIAYGISFWLMGRMNGFSSVLWQVISLFLIAGLVFLFVRFTYKAPKFPIFQNRGNKTCL